MPAFSPDHLLSCVAAFHDARCCWIGYSGGLDSEVLLHAAVSVRGSLRPEVHAVHVDHGLQPAAGEWAKHCRARCDRLGVPLAVVPLTVKIRQGESLEAAAREARYEALAALMEPGDLLLTAHHRGDQAETLLLALMRGSGVRGLAAMPLVSALGRGRMVRPLLDFSRDDLRAYAKTQGLEWVDDPSNEDLARDRNFLRHRVLPLLAERWPSCERTMARSAGHCAEAEQLVAELAERTIASVGGKRPGTLSISGVRMLPAPLGRAVVRQWISTHGFRPPDAKRLGRILDEVLTARLDATPLVSWSGCEVRRSRDDLFALAPPPALPDGQPLQWAIGMLALPPGLGRLSLLDSSGNTLNPRDICSGGFTVRFGAGGLTCQEVSGPRHHRTLKKLFQEGGVPSWLRRYIPLIFARGVLMAVGDLWLCVSPCTETTGPVSFSWQGHPWEEWLHPRVVKARRNS